MALAGYNPNMSLLPSGNGPIQPMSGGGMGTPPPGFNASNSLLPPAGGSINPFSGGFFNQPIHIIGGSEKPTDLKQDKITSTSFDVTWNKIDPATAYTATATPKITLPATPATSTTPSNAPKTINGILDNFKGAQDENFSITFVFRHESFNSLKTYKRLQNEICF